MRLRESSRCNGFKVYWLLYRWSNYAVYTFRSSSSSGAYPGGFPVARKPPLSVRCGRGISYAHVYWVRVVAAHVVEATQNCFAECESLTYWAVTVFAAYIGTYSLHVKSWILINRVGVRSWKPPLQIPAYAPDLHLQLPLTYTCWSMSRLLQLPRLGLHVPASTTTFALHFKQGS